MARAKICGITGREDLEVAIDAGADAVGFIVDVTVDTPREIDPGVAEQLAALTPPFVTGTLVTMPDTAAQAVTLADLVGVDAVQVHGLPAEDVAVVGETFQGAVLAAVSADQDEATLRAYAGASDALLLDTPTESGGGGTGETHDWKRARDVADSVEAPVVLAGGLTPRNVRAAVGTVNPYAVDVASGVERTGGVKDHDAVRAFVREAGGAA